MQNGQLDGSGNPIVYNLKNVCKIIVWGII